MYEQFYANRGSYEVESYEPWVMSEKIYMTVEEARKNKRARHKTQLLVNLWTTNNNW